MSYGDSLAPESVAAHDLARAVPEEMWSVVVDGLAEHVPPGGLCVDVGAGTGAVTGRLAARSVDVVGIDVNRSMLASLRESHPRLPIVVADAQAMPVRDGCAPLVVMACVLHLVADWRLALREAVRVAAPGGVLAVNVGQSALAGRTGVSRTFLAALAERIEIPPMPGPSAGSDVADELIRLGCVAVGPLVANGTAPRTVRDHIVRLEWNPFGWPPGIPQWALAEAAAATTAWAEGAFGSIDEPNETPVSLGFALFRAP